MAKWLRLQAEEAQVQTIIDGSKLAQNNPVAILIIDQESGGRNAAAFGATAGG